MVKLHVANLLCSTIFSLLLKWENELSCDELERQARKMNQDALSGSSVALRSTPISGGCLGSGSEGCLRIGFEWIPRGKKVIGNCASS